MNCVIPSPGADGNHLRGTGDTAFAVIAGAAADPSKVTCVGNAVSPGALAQNSAAGGQLRPDAAGNAQEDVGQGERGALLVAAARPEDQTLTPNPDSIGPGEAVRRDDRLTHRLRQPKRIPFHAKRSI
jgi:hypothetical protein